jgi:hypothetical protein
MPNFIIIVALALVLIVLIVGVVGMAKGGEFNRKYGNKLMRMRVVLQFVAIMLILLGAYLQD